MKRFWFVISGYRAHLVLAANREAANAKFKLQHPDTAPLYSGPAELCPDCYKCKPPIDKHVQRLQYPEAQPCDCGHQHTTHFLGDNVNERFNPLTPAQIN